MPKTITIRLDNETYELFRYAALGNKRTISNYIEFAALNYTLNDQLVSYEEMEEIRPAFKSIRKGLEEIKEGKYRIVK